MPPYLRWRAMTGAEIQGGSCVKHGKEVRLSGDGYEALPRNFSIHRKFGFILRRFREQREKGGTAAVGLPQSAAPTGSDGAQTDGVILRSPGRRLKWRMFFEDDHGNASEELHVSRIGTFGVPSVQVLGNGLDLKIVFTAAIDPHIEVSLLVPWGDGEEDFHQYRDELAMDAREEDEEPADAVAALTEYLGRYLPDEPPEGWEFELERAEIDLDEGESAELGISIHAPTPGEVAFAVQVVAEVDGERAAVASDPMVVRVPEDNGQEAELLGGDDGRSGDSGADLLPPQDQIVSAQGQIAEAQGGPSGVESFISNSLPTPAE